MPEKGNVSIGRAWGDGAVQPKEVDMVSPWMYYKAKIYTVVIHFLLSYFELEYVPAVGA